MSKLLVDEISDADNTGPVTVTDGLTVQGAFTSLGIDDNATSTAMTLDASGNLLVGTTTANSNNTGIGLTQDDVIYVTRSGGRPLLLNRQTSDGDIAEFRKDGTTVGSIRSRAGVVTTLILDPRTSVGTGVGITGASQNAILPTDAGGNLEDNAIDLGELTTRFKNLYLSGGVVFNVAGGTGTSTSGTLDDYEEGTFNPFSGIGSAYTGEVVRNAKYTKIGRMVSVDVRVEWTGTDGGGGDASLTLPFTAGAATGTATAFTGAVFYSGSQLFSGAAIVTHTSAGGNSFSFYRTSGSTFSSVSRSSTNGSYDFVCSFVYYVA